MATYVAFLRAVNLGARRKFPKTELASVTEAAGFTGVETYINTGNVRVETRMRSRERVEEVLERAYLADRGFEVPTIAFAAAELAEVAAAGAELEACRSVPPGRHHVSLLKHPPTPERTAELEALSTDAEQVVVRGRAVHLMIGEAYHLARVDNARVEKLFGVATNRTLAVVTTLARRWCSP